MKSEKTSLKNSKRGVWARLVTVMVGAVLGLGVIGTISPVLWLGGQPVYAAQDTSGDAASGEADGADAKSEDDNCVETAILFGGRICDNGDGSSILRILNLVVDIMTMGIGILGVIGITVVGIQYLTANGSEEKTRKAKTRMLEIVIGLVAYAMIYALVKWLMPSVQ